MTTETMSVEELDDKVWLDHIIASAVETEGDYDGFILGRAEYAGLIALARRSIAPWEPIETAPKDGTRIVLWIVNEAQLACFEDGYWCGEDDQPVYGTPTHWLPLPPPPAQSEERKEDVVGMGTNNHNRVGGDCLDGLDRDPLTPPPDAPASGERTAKLIEELAPHVGMKFTPDPEKIAQFDKSLPSTSADVAELCDALCQEAAAVLQRQERNLRNIRDCYEPQLEHMHNVLAEKEREIERLKDALEKADDGLNFVYLYDPALLKGDRT